MKPLIDQDPLLGEDPLLTGKTGGRTHFLGGFYILVGLLAGPSVSVRWLGWVVLGGASAHLLRLWDSPK